MSRRFLLIFLCTGGIAFSGCGPQRDNFVEPSLTQCSTNVAQIAVYDGVLQIMCGCTAETSGTTFTPPASLTCTINSGSTVIFHFLGNELRHQIASVGSPSFSSSHLTDPDDELTDLPYGAVFSTPGTYSFQDALVSGVGGQIIVL